MKKTVTLILIYSVCLLFFGCTAKRTTYYVDFAYSNLTSELVSNKSEYILPKATMSGFIFEGWYEDENFDTRINVIPKGYQFNIQVYAKFTKKVDLFIRKFDSYIVTFDSKGGNAVSSQLVDKENYLKQPFSPKKTGHVFGGWFENENCLGSMYNFSSDVKKDLTLYAKWIEIPQSGFKALTINTTETNNFLAFYYFVPLGKTTLSTTMSDAVMSDLIVYVYDLNGLLVHRLDRTNYLNPSSIDMINLVKGEMYKMVISFDGVGSRHYSVTLKTTFNDTGKPMNEWELYDSVELIYKKKFNLPISNSWEYFYPGWRTSFNEQVTNYKGESIEPFNSNISELFFYTTNLEK